MTSQHKTGTHPFLWQASIRPVLIHFYDKPAEDQYSSIFMTSWQKTGAHPFYIGMYIHIYTHIYVHIYTSQKECLHIFYHACLEEFCVVVSNHPFWWNILKYHQIRWIHYDRIHDRRQISQSEDWWGDGSCGIRNMSSSSSNKKLLSQPQRKHSGSN